MKRDTKCILALIVLSLFYGCSSIESEYLGILDTDVVDIHFSRLSSDTVTIDASATSCSGHWLMCDSLIYFVDEHAVSIRKYSCSGDDLGEQVAHGRGPDEMISPALFSSFDMKDSTLFLCDGNCWLTKYNLDFKQTFCSKMVWFNPLLCIDTDEVNYLVEHPDPNNMAMYEHNFDCSRLFSSGNEAILPIVTEHVAYNGYFIENNAADYWKNSYILLSCDVNNIGGSAKLIGHYPPFYQTGNYPVFSLYDYIVTDKGILISFAADKKIYMLDYDGHPVYSFGHAGQDVSDNYPQTYDFEEYESECTRHREEYGYYGTLFRDNELLFRTYHTNKNEWRLQIYKEKALYGDIDVKYPLEIFGKYNGFYYAYAYTDYENEQFKLVKFKLE